MSNNNRLKVVRTVCKECGMNCGMLAEIEDGQVVRLTDDPSSPKGKDKLCWKASAGLERLYHPNRLNVPLKRAGKRGEGIWEEISWDEAIQTIADRFNRLKEDSGAESVALVKGAYSRRCDLISRLGNAFGTPNITGIDNTCYIPSASGRLMTYGFDGRPDFSGAPDCVMCWGSSTLPPLRDDAKFIVINSIQTEAAKKADIWLQPRPGSDLALALGFLNVIVNETLYSQKFVKEWTIGFDQLRDHVQQYPPEKVSALTWVPADQIVFAARVFSGHENACLHMGNASEDTVNSTQFARAISIIQAICGYLDIPGGTIDGRAVPIDWEGSSADVLYTKLSQDQLDKKLGSTHKHFPPDPLWNPIVNKPAELQFQYLLDSALGNAEYQIQAALVMGGNPVITWCNSTRVREAFMNIPFLVVTELVMTPTALLADIVLPAASYLECDAVNVSNIGFGDTYLQAQQKTVQVGERRSNFDIVISLANKMGLGEFFWKDVPSYLDDYLKDVGLTFDELRRCNRLIHSGTTYRKYLSKGFNTPSGKVEIVSSLCEKWGYETLPTYHEAKETPFSDADLAKSYTLILTSAHDKNYTHSQDRYLKTIRDKYPTPLVGIHPETAEKLGISDNDSVYIENKRGRIKQTAVLTTTVDPRVINVAYGWWFPEKGATGKFGWDESNINVLTDDSPPYSPEIGSPTMRGFLCKVYKAE